MKISVISNSSGEIVAAWYTPVVTVSPASELGADTAAVPAGHRLHQVSLPAELAEKILAGDFAGEISKWAVQVKGKKAALVGRSSGKSPGRR